MSDFVYVICLSTFLGGSAQCLSEYGLKSASGPWTVASARRVQKMASSVQKLL